MHATKKTSFRSRAIWLVAFALVVTAPRLPAEIFVDSRISSVSAFAQANTMMASPPPKVQDGLLPADLSNSASASDGSASASVSGSLHSDITLDPVAGTLRLTGNGTASGHAIQPSGGLGAGSFSNPVVLHLSITLTEISYSYTLTGQVSATSSSGLNQGTQGTGEAFLFQGASLLLDVLAVSQGGMSDSKPLAESGTLPPGNYTFGVSAQSQQNAIIGEPETSSSGSANFVFELHPVGAPTPTPSPAIQWNNPAGGSFETAANWDPQMVPGTNDTALFGLANPYLIDVGTGCNRPARDS